MVQQAFLRPYTAWHDDALRYLAWALSSLRGRLEPKEAAPLAPKVVEFMAKTTDPEARHSLAVALSSLVGLLEPQEAATLAPKVVEAMATDNPYALPFLAQALSSLAGWLEPHEAADRAVVARALGEEASPAMRLSGLAALLQASQPPPCRLATQELVDLLKMPTCVGDGRDVVLRLLG